MNDRTIKFIVVVSFIFTACINKSSAPIERSQEDGTISDFNESAASKKELNRLSEDEKAKGWQLLFDGKTTNGWHTYLQDKVEGWQVKDGVLYTPGKQGDIVTDKEFQNFELIAEWKIQEQGNSGIFYYVVEKPEYKRIYETGPEFQIIDDENYPQELTDKQKTGANSDVQAPSAFVSKRPGEWNRTRILVNQGHVEHWLNGQKIIEYNFNSPEYKQRVANSKFASMDYGKIKKGRIGFQDHGRPVAFCNIKIKEL
jgi:translation elongation factor P/translation initiation factor 5A